MKSIGKIVGILALVAVVAVAAFYGFVLLTAWL